MVVWCAASIDRIDETRLYSPAVTSSSALCEEGSGRAPSASSPRIFLFCQNIIKKVSGQKFVYKFVSQPDPSMPDGARSGDESLRRDSADPNGQSKALGGVASACPPKSLPQVHFLCL